MAALKVLVVDDSVVFRSQIKAALEQAPQVEVVGVANNGKIALAKLAQGSVDLVTLDMEMPEMDGIATLKEIRKLKYPVRVVVFSSHTSRGSEKTLEALSAGADDFVAKPSGPSDGLQSAHEKISGELIPKVLQFMPSSAPAPSTPATAPTGPAARPFTFKDLATFRPSCIVIGSSTGGPPALEKVLAGITAPIKIPIFIAQHMPPVFTAALAKRLEDVTKVPAAEGKQGEVVSSNRIYVAPGDYHMKLKSNGASIQIELDKTPPRNSVRPAVDHLFESAAQVYGAKCLGVVLTGMGEDGRVGAQQIKEVNGGIVIQDRASCVVFGMPGSVHAVGAYDEIFDPLKIQALIKRVTS